MKKYIWILMCLPLVVMAQTPEEKGLKLAIGSDEYNAGFGDSASQMTMTLKNAHGDVSVRKMTSKTLEVSGDGDKGLTVFKEPADIKGTAFLSFTHILDADDQWLYLPALKRVKRISSKNKSGPFMGSEFAFEDLSSPEVPKYSYTFLSEETIAGEACYVVELKPKYKYSGYTRSIIWLSKAMHQPVKVEYYDRKNALLKTMNASDFNQYLGHYWRPNRMVMINHQTKKETQLDFSNYSFKTGLTSRDFNKNSLKRAR